MKHYVCPKCGATEDLGVYVMTSARLIQFDEDGNFETEIIDSHHEWTDEHTMWCEKCGHSDGAGSFYVKETADAPR
jgi:predicted nucleic-acid-binding Zn-ribbon protein